MDMHQLLLDRGYEPDHSNFQKHQNTTVSYHNTKPNRIIYRDDLYEEGTTYFFQWAMDSHIRSCQCKSQRIAFIKKRIKTKADLDKVEKIFGLINSMKY